MANIKLDDALKAVEGSRGNHTTIAKKIGCSRSHITYLRKKWATFDEAVQEAKEARKDWVEGMLDERIASGDTTAIIFFLKTQGKDRGYIERQEHRVEGDIEITYLNHWKKDEN